MNRTKTCALITLIIAIMLTLSGCLGSDNKLDGKYVCTTNSNLYIEFKGSSIVTIHNDTGDHTGMYLCQKQNDTAVAAITVDNQEFILIINGDTLTDMQTVYEKETIWGFIKKNWLTILIGLFVFGLIYTIIDKIVIKKTGHSIEHHSDRFFDDEDD